MCVFSMFSFSVRHRIAAKELLQLSLSRSIVSIVCHVQDWCHSESQDLLTRTPIDKTGSMMMFRRRCMVPPKTPESEGRSSSWTDEFSFMERRLIPLNPNPVDPQTPKIFEPLCVTPIFF